jgi:RNA polymerase sigma-54 factor
MEPRLSLRMTQRLVLTPTLQQAIKLLQYSRQELVQYIRQEMLENPTLEEVSAAETSQEEPVSETQPESPAVEEEVKDTVEGLSEEGEPDWTAYLAEGDNGFEPYAPTEAPSYENIVSSRVSLQDHLLQQLTIALNTDEEKIIGFEIIGNIDDDGYLRAETEEIARTLQVASEEVERVLRHVQDFDPSGVGARTLAESLVSQLKNRGLEGGTEERIVRAHLGDLEAKRLKKIARSEKISIDEVQRAARLITSLEPRPGRSFSQESVQYVVPDITISKVGDEYQVQLVDEGLPRLRISGFYRRLFRSGRLSSSDKEFLDKRVNSARWLIKSILQRQQTIIRVSRSIVKFQKEFLDNGVRSLKPLVLRQVAEDINMHESTVSRVTSKKYAETPQGILELKFFFNSGINRSGGESMASVSVMALIRKIISDENASRPLSDQEIVRRLRGDHSLDIARRTVAKYRGLMNIMPASRRRQVY